MENQLTFLEFCAQIWLECPLFQASFQLDMGLFVSIGHLDSWLSADVVCFSPLFCVFQLTKGGVVKQLFRGLSTEADPHVAVNCLYSGEFPSFRGAYLWISAYCNSVVLTAVSMFAGVVSRFPLELLVSSTEVELDCSVMYYQQYTKVNKRLSAYQWKFSKLVNAISLGNAYSRMLRDPITNEPAMLQFYAPSQTQVDTSDPENLFYRFTPTNASVQKVVSLQDVIHEQFFS